MDSDARDRNFRAHEGLDRIPFPHRTVNQFALRKIEGHFPDRGGGDEVDRPRVLDVGCGAGYLLQVMLARGWDAWGIDPFPRGAALESPLRDRITASTLESLNGPGFDAITAIEVLEHVEDYTGLILQMFRHLLPGGILVVTVPHDWEFQVDFAPDGSPEPRYGHLWRFRAGDLSADLKQLGASALVEPIYSRSLDRRHYRFSRLLPAGRAMKLSDSLTAKRSDGAWLLGSVSRGAAGEGNIPLILKPSTAVHYTRVHPFDTGDQAVESSG